MCSIQSFLRMKRNGAAIRSSSIVYKLDINDLVVEVFTFVEVVPNR